MYLNYLTGVSSSSITGYRLRGFCDASTKAYTAVLYLNVKFGDCIHTRFLTSNTRVAPTKTQTALKLELLARLVQQGGFTTRIEGGIGGIDPTGLLILNYCLCRPLSWNCQRNN